MQRDSVAIDFEIYNTKIFFFLSFLVSGQNCFDEHTPLTRTVQGKVACCYKFNQRTLYFNELLKKNVFRKRSVECSKRLLNDLVQKMLQLNETFQSVCCFRVYFESIAVVAHSDSGAISEKTSDINP